MTNDTTPPEGEHAPSDEDLRFRLERGDGLCLNEHTVHKADDVREFWITCGDEHFGRVVFSVHASTDEVAAWMQMTMEKHRASTAERIVGQQLAELDEWRSIAADLAEAVEPFDFTMRGGQAEYDNLVAHMERRDAALARYREAAGQ